MKHLFPMLVLAVLSSCLAAAEPDREDFWVPDAAGSIRHTGTGKEPLVMCMQGRKVVMQVQVDRATGFSYKARFFNVQPDRADNKKIMFEGGQRVESLRCGSTATVVERIPVGGHLRRLLTLTYPESQGVVATRTVYPSMPKALVIDEWQLRNTAARQSRWRWRPPAGESRWMTRHRAWSGAARAGSPLRWNPAAWFRSPPRVQARLAAAPDMAHRRGGGTRGAPGVGRGGVARPRPVGNARADARHGVRLAETPRAGMPDRDRSRGSSPTMAA